MHEEGQTFQAQAGDARISYGPKTRTTETEPITMGLVDRLNGDVGVLGELVSMLEKKLEPVREPTPEKGVDPSQEEMTGLGQIARDLEMHTARLSQLFHEIAL